MRARLVALSLALLASCAMAADQAGLSEKDFLGEVPIVLSVSRLPQPLNEAPGAVTVIDRETIRRSGARELADVLRLVPGFQMAEVRGGNPVAVYHGTAFENANRIQVLVDGRSVYSPFYTGTASIGMRTVPLEDIERIEVLRGSNSATYGARAMLGVINIVTRDTADTIGSEAGVRAGRRDVADASARIGWGNPSASFRLSAERRGDAGLLGVPDDNRLANLGFRGDLRLGTRDTLELRAGASDQRWSDGFAGTAANPLRTRRYYGSFLQADWRRSLSTDGELRVSFSHSEEHYQDRYTAQLAGLPAFLVDFGGRGRVDAIEVNHRFSAGPKLRLSWGGEYRVEGTRSQALYATSSWLTTRFARLHGNVEWRLRPDLILNAGMMYEDNSAAGGELMPRAMLNWLVTRQHTLRAGLSRAHRPPSIFERASDQRFSLPGLGMAQNWLSRPGLRPERLSAAEVGYYGDWRALRLVLDVRLFEERIKDFSEVTRLPVPASAGAVNADSNSFANGRPLRLRGFEYQISWRPGASTRVLLNQSYVATDFPRDANFLSVPSHTASAALFQRLPGNWDLALIHGYSGAMTWAGAGGLMESRHRTDLRLAHRFRLADAQAEAALVVQNLGGATPEYLPQLEFGRRVFATLRVALD